MSAGLAEERVMKDLVERLRNFDWYGPPRKGADELLNEAAAELARMYCELKDTRAGLAACNKVLQEERAALRPSPELCGCGEFCNKSIGQVYVGWCRRLAGGLPVHGAT